MVRTENSMYVPVPHDQPYYFPSMVGTQDNMFSLARVSPTQMVDNIRSTSHTQSRLVNNISSQSATVASQFVDLNVHADPNVPSFFFSFAVGNV
ncbi:hypothetical protein ACSBR1_033543 [Camellia fascicularis]